MKWIVALTLCAGCGSRPAREICEHAADHFERCVGEVFGTDMKQLARDHREVSSCANDAATVKMYENCEAQKSCAQYLDCLDGFKASE